MRTLFQLSLLAALLSALPAVFSEEEHKEVPSPDQHFVFKFTDADPDVPYGIFEKESGKLLFKAPQDTITSFVNTVSCVWSPDSKQFALNFRIGARYNTNLLFRWNGKEFVALPSIDDVLDARLDAEKEADRKMQGIKKDAYQRRIWDSFTVRRWIDPDTIEVDGYSIRTVMLKEDDFAEISGSSRFQIQRDKKGKWKITKQKHIPIEEMEKND